MTEKKNFILYTVIWAVALLIVMLFLFQNVGDARIINYSGIVRGATQQLVKEELAGEENDALIEKLDAIVLNLRTGKGDYGLRKSGSENFQEQLSALQIKWEEIKKEIAIYRAAEDKSEAAKTLFADSELHFTMANELVGIAERYSEIKLWSTIGFLTVYLAVSVAAFAFFYRRNRAALQKSLITDRLTGIANRSGFEARSAEILKTRGGAYAMIKFDVEDFKSLNTTYGYEFGDSVLKIIAVALDQRFSDAGACARITADDFMVLYQNEDDLIDTLKKTVIDALKEKTPLSITETFSFNVGVYAVEKGTDVKTMLEYANIAHKNAKTAGGNRVVWYDEKLVERLKYEKSLSSKMYQGLADEEFKMVLQPKFDMRDMALIGAEALVRWEIPENGTIFPDAFIPLFERNGSIVELDFYMLERVCRHLAERIRRGEKTVPISVNFSRVSIYYKDFYQRFLEIVGRYGVPSHLIEIEITESAFNGISDLTRAMLESLREKGFLLDMDDFGSGYSSLNLLNTLRIDQLKLDRDFLKEFEAADSDTARNIIGCVVDLARALNVKVVCEGVETGAQADFLRTIRCDYGQGYFFSKPISESEFIEKYYSEQGSK